MRGKGCISVLDLVTHVLSRACNNLEVGGTQGTWDSFISFQNSSSRYEIQQHFYKYNAEKFLNIGPSFTLCLKPEPQDRQHDDAMLLVTGHDKQEYSDCLGDDGMESVTDNDDNDVQHDHGQGQPVIIKYCSMYTGL